MSDGDFSLMTESEQLTKLEKIRKETEKLKVQHEMLLKDQQRNIEMKDSNLEYTQKFQMRSVTLKKDRDAEKVTRAETLKKEQKKLDDLKEEQRNLKTSISNVEKELIKMEETNQSLKQQTEVSTAVPEKKVVFNGETTEVAGALSFDMKPNIVYPMEGGTAFITFEEEEVAKKILSLKEHVVQLGDCSITVQAEPVRFLVPNGVEMNTHVCPHRILVSNLPKKESVEKILDKMEIYFSKTRNGGGEVEETDYLEDSGNVVIKFVDGHIARSLTDKQSHEIEFERNRKHKVKVTPFLNGEITQLQTANVLCHKTVLLTGIPDVMEQDNLQDLLEIHFQKTANSGGEVDAIIYNPVGKTTLAVFEEDSAKEEGAQ